MLSGAEASAAMLPCCAGLPVIVRLCFGQPCSPFEAGALPVLRPSRRMHIRLRGRVLGNPPRLKGLRPASARNKAAHGTLGSCAKTTHARPSLRGKARLLPRAASTVRSAILRRRDTAPHTHAVSPTFRYGAFFFVVSALADVPSTRLTLSRG